MNIGSYNAGEYKCHEHFVVWVQALHRSFPLLEWNLSGPAKEGHAERSSVHSLSIHPFLYSIQVFTEH